MTIRELVDQIPVQGLQGGDIFAAYRRGEVSWDDWFIYEAIRSCELQHEQAPRQYPRMSEGARSYVRGRLSGAMPYDYPLAKTLGEWFWQVKQTQEYNSERLGFFLWCLEKVEPKGLAEHAAKARHAIARFEAAHFPYEAVQDTIIVKQKDASAREKRS